jgi:hypothetical protein
MGAEKSEGRRESRAKKRARIGRKFGRNDGAKQAKFGRKPGRIYPQNGRDLHRNKSAESGKCRGILFSTEEKSFREESGTEASREDRQRDSIRATEDGR